MRNTMVMLVTTACGIMALLAGCHAQATSDEAGAREAGGGTAPAIYLLSAQPSWTGDVQTMEHADPASFGRRMVILAARAVDGRHLVLIQSPTYNRMFRPRVRQGGVLVYTSPNGFKVWGGGPQKWYSGILLRSARATIKDPPAEGRIGYVLESPAGTLPALAVNGPVTEEELHWLVDSLVPAQECPRSASEGVPRSGTP